MERMPARLPVDGNICRDVEYEQAERNHGKEKRTMETIKERPRILRILASILLPSLWLLAAILLVATAEVVAEYAGAGTDLGMLAGELLGWLPASLLTILYLDKKHGKPERRPLPAPAFAKACIGYALLGEMPLQLALRSLGPYDLSGESALRIAIGILAAPAVEELAFRACLFRMSRRGLGFKAAMLLNLAMFAFVHGNMLGYIIATLPLVAANTAAYERTGDIRICIAFHMTANVLFYLMAGIVIPAYIAIPLFIACIVLLLRRVFKAARQPDSALFPLSQGPLQEEPCYPEA